MPGTRAPWPAFSARGGIKVTFLPDGQQYRVYNLLRGDRDPPSFVAEYNNNGCASDAECSGSECVSGVCHCAPNHYGADCAAVDECIGTTTSTAERGTFVSAARALEARHNNNDCCDDNNCCNTNHSATGNNSSTPGCTLRRLATWRPSRSSACSPRALATSSASCA